MISVALIILYILTFPGSPLITSKWIWGKRVDLSAIGVRQTNELKKMQDKEYDWAKSQFPEWLFNLIRYAVAIPVIVVHAALWHFYDVPLISLLAPFLYLNHAYHLSQIKIVQRQYLYELKLSTLCPKCEYDTQQLNTARCPECNFDLDPKLHPKGEGKTFIKYD